MSNDAPEPAPPPNAASPAGQFPGGSRGWAEQLRRLQEHRSTPEFPFAQLVAFPAFTAFEESSRRAAGVLRLRLPSPDASCAGFLVGVVLYSIVLIFWPLFAYIGAGAASILIVLALVSPLFLGFHLAQLRVWFERSDDAAQLAATPRRRSDWFLAILREPLTNYTASYRTAIHFCHVAMYLPLIVAGARDMAQEGLPVGVAYLFSFCIVLPILSFVLYPVLTAPLLGIGALGQLSVLRAILRGFDDRDVSDPNELRNRVVVAWLRSVVVFVVCVPGLWILGASLAIAFGESFPYVLPFALISMLAGPILAVGGLLTAGERRLDTAHLLTMNDLGIPLGSMAVRPGGWFQALPGTDLFSSRLAETRVRARQKAEVAATESPELVAMLERHGGDPVLNGLDDFVDLSNHRAFRAYAADATDSGGMMSLRLPSRRKMVAGATILLVCYGVAVGFGQYYVIPLPAIAALLLAFSAPLLMGFHLARLREWFDRSEAAGDIACTPWPRLLWFLALAKISLMRFSAAYRTLIHAGYASLFVAGWVSSARGIFADVQPLFLGLLVSAAIAGVFFLFATFLYPVVVVPFLAHGARLELALLRRVIMGVEQGEDVDLSDLQRRVVLGWLLHTTITLLVFALVVLVQVLPDGLSPFAVASELGNVLLRVFFAVMTPFLAMALLLSKAAPTGSVVRQVLTRLGFHTGSDLLRFTNWWRATPRPHPTDPR